MSGFQGDAPSPTFRSIFGGIAVALLLLFAFLNLAALVKYAGAVLAFVPSKIGLIQTVKPAEVISLDLASSPTKITVAKPGNYILYTDNYDLLVINDAVMEKGSKPWLKIENENKDVVPINLIGRGLAFYDTVFGKGRPVASFEIKTPGTYSITHPSRPTIATIVPDYISGQENWISFLYIVELVILIVVVFDIRATIRERKRKASESLNAS